MKTQLLTLAAALALFAVLGKFYAIPALGQAVRAALVQDRDNPARTAFTVKVPVNDITSPFPTVPPGKRMIITNMYFNVIALVSNAQCQANVFADNGHESHYALAVIPDFRQLTLAGSAPFDLALDAGQTGGVSLFCSTQIQNSHIVLTTFPTDVGAATASEMDVVYSGYFIDIP